MLRSKDIWKCAQQDVVFINPHDRGNVSRLLQTTGYHVRGYHWRKHLSMRQYDQPRRRLANQSMFFSLRWQLVYQLWWKPDLRSLQHVWVDFGSHHPRQFSRSRMARLLPVAVDFCLQLYQSVDDSGHMLSRLCSVWLPICWCLYQPMPMSTRQADRSPTRVPNVLVSLPR